MFIPKIVYVPNKEGHQYIRDTWGSMSKGIKISLLLGISRSGYSPTVSGWYTKNGMCEFFIELTEPIRNWYINISTDAVSYNLSGGISGYNVFEGGDVLEEYFVKSYLFRCINRKITVKDAARKLRKILGINIDLRKVNSRKLNDLEQAELIIKLIDERR